MAVVAIGLLLSAAAWAGGEARTFFERGVEAAQAGHYADAVAAFEAARSAGLDSSALYFNLGVAYYKSGRVDAAVDAFRAAVDRGDMAAPAAYQLGRIARQREDTEAAEHWFGVAARRADTAELRRRARQRLGPARASPWSARLTAAAGYDTNPRLEPEDLPGGSTDADAFVEAFAATRRALPGSWHADASVYAQRFDTLAAFDLTSARLAGTGRWPIDGTSRISLTSDVEAIWLDGASLEQSLGATVDYARPGPLGQRLRLSARAYVIDGGSDFGYLDGNGYGLGAALRPGAGAGGWSVELALGRRDRDDLRSADRFNSLSWRQIELTTQWRRQLGAGVELTLAAAARQRVYDDPERRDGRTLGRRDAARGRVSARLDGRWSSAWGWYSEAAVEGRDADLERFDYARETFRIGLDYSF